MAKKPRPKIPADKESALLWACDNTCSMCTSERLPPYVIHHIDGNPSNNSIDNLIALCLKCNALAESRSRTARYPRGRTLKALKAKWERIIAQRRKLQSLPRGMEMTREIQEPSGRIIREKYSWESSYINGRAEEAIQAAGKIAPEAMQSEEGKLAWELAKWPNKKKARQAASRLKGKPSKRRLAKTEEGVVRYSLSMAKGQFHFMQGEYTDAITCYRAARGQAEKLRSPALVFLSLFDLGAAYGMLGDDAQAYHLFKRAIKLRPDDAKVHYCLGLALGQKGDAEGAIAAYREAIRIKRDYAEAHNNLGVALGQKGDTEGAIAEFREAIRIEPDDAEAHNNLGVALGHKGDGEGEIAEFREAIRIKPDYAKAHKNLGVALGQKGDTQGAIAAYREAIRINPDYAEAHYNLGLALGQKGDTEGKIAAYREAIRVKPDLAQAHYNLGVALGQKGDTEGKIAAYREAIRIKPDLAQAHYNLGVALGQKGDTKGAIAEFRKAIRIKPDYAEAHHNLGVALFQAGRHDEGIEAFEQAIRFRQSLPDFGRTTCLNFVGYGVARAEVFLRGENTRGACKVLGKIRALYLQTKSKAEIHEADIHKGISYVLSNLLGRLMVQNYEMGAKILRLLRLPEMEKTLSEGRYLREIAILRDLLVSAYEPEKIIVYGSCAAGDVSAGSDIDLLIVKEGVEGKDLIERKLEVMKLIGAINPGVKIEPVVHTSRELEEKLKSSSFYRDEIMAKGWVIYEKGR